MSTTVRDVIVNALSRANICSKRQPAPGYMVETAFDLLRGIASKYSKDNLLQFLRRELIIPKNIRKTTLTIGEYGLSEFYTEGVNFFFINKESDKEKLPEASYETMMARVYAWDKDRTVMTPVQTGQNSFVWRTTSYSSKEAAIGNMMDLDGHHAIEFIPDVEVSNLASVREMYARNGSDDDDNDYPLDFVSYEDFRNPLYGSGVYTWQPLSDKHIEVRLKKPMVDSVSNGFVLVYNCSYSFTLDDELRIPENYVELFTTALVYALAIKYPKLDAQQVARLKDEKLDMERNIAVPTRANKLILRNNGIRSCTNRSRFLSGEFLYGGR